MRVTVNFRKVRQVEVRCFSLSLYTNMQLIFQIISCWEHFFRTFFPWSDRSATMHFWLEAGCSRQGQRYVFALRVVDSAALQDSNSHLSDSQTGEQFTAKETAITLTKCFRSFCGLCGCKSNADNINNANTTALPKLSKHDVDIKTFKTERKQFKIRLQLCFIASWKTQNSLCKCVWVRNYSQQGMLG